MGCVHSLFGSLYPLATVFLHVNSSRQLRLCLESTSNFLSLPGEGEEPGDPSGDVVEPPFIMI